MHHTCIHTYIHVHTHTYINIRCVRVYLNSLGVSMASQDEVEGVLPGERWLHSEECMGSLLQTEGTTEVCILWREGGREGGREG